MREVYFSGIDAERNQVPSFSSRLGFAPQSEPSSIMTLWTKQERNPAYDQVEERLQIVHDVIRSTLQAGSNRRDFAEASGSLLRQVQGLEQGEARDDSLLGAYVASMLDETPRHRIEFLEDVFSSHVNADLARLCSGIGGSIYVYGKDYWVSARDLKGFFELPHRVAETFLHKLDNSMVEERLPRKLQAQLFNAMPDEALEELRERAQRASLSDEKVSELINDSSKIERFALGQQFITDQMRAVLGNNLAHAPLTVALQEKMTPEKEGDIVSLRRDMAQAFIELSQPVVEQYQTDRAVGEGYEGLTKQQKATVRFRQLRAEALALKEAGKFINSGARRQLRNDFPILEIGLSEEDVWGASVDGAAAPAIAAEALAVLTDQARLRTDLRITPEELLSLAQEKRRELLAIATVGIEDIDKHFNEGLFVVGSEHLTFVRDEAGKLGLSHSLKPNFKDSAEMRAGVILGCPALRVKHEDSGAMSQEEKLLHGSANVVDHVLAIAFNEAYRRGIFSV